LADYLILTGFMGSGKTAVGRRLAGELGWDFFDADQLIEERAGMPIVEIFEAQGEAGFRRIEEEVVLGLLDRGQESSRGSVISLGGGAVTIPIIYERLLTEALVILLDVDVEAAFGRARDGRRPLAADRDEFEQLYRERETLYRGVAKGIIDTRGLGVDQVAGKIIEFMWSGKDSD